MRYEEIEPLFAERLASGEQALRIEAINRAACALAKVVHRNTQICADQSASIRKIREARDLARDAVLLEGTGARV